MTPRTAYVVKRYPRYSETFIVNELLAHQARGFEVEIFALRPPNDHQFQDAISRVRAPVHYLPHAGIKARDLWEEAQAARKELPGFDAGMAAALGESAIDAYQALALARAVHARGIEHLHAHFASSPTTVARLAAKFAGITYTFTAHAKDIYHAEVEDEDLRRKVRDAAAVVTVSSFNVRQLRSLDAASADRVVRVYNGLHLDEFAFDDSTARPNRILAVGRLVPKKGFDVLVDACAALEKRGMDFDCRIVGAGSEEIALREQIVKHGLEGRVRLSGPMPQADVRREMRGAAVFAAPCVVAEDGNRDGLPTTLLESMAIGTPCVSTDVTGIPEIIRHESTGLVVAQHDAAGLADALHRLLKNPGERTTLARNARALIEERFDVQRNADELRAVFADAHSRATPRRASG